MDKTGRKTKKPPRKTPSRREPREESHVAPRFYYKGSRLKQLRAFCMIVKLGTLSRAAEALFLSQPSISLQLRALEDELAGAEAWATKYESAKSTARHTAARRAVEQAYAALEEHVARFT